MPPFRIAEYSVERTLGIGSFGEVFLARDASGAAVAIKVLLADASRDADVRRRFEREARAALGVRHPNVVAALATGVHEDRPYLVCEFAPGGTLLDLLNREGRLASERALSLAADVFRGLDAIHCAGLVHRDLKPANVLLSAEGRAQIADLGMTRSVAVQRTMLTKEGMILGTPAYMAPEQIEYGESVDARADLYSAGVVIYQMLTGALPFQRADPLDMLRDHVGAQPPDPSRSAPVDSEVSALVLSLLAKKPGDRPRDARAALSRVEELRARPSAAAVLTLADSGADPRPVGPSATRSDAQAVGPTIPDAPGGTAKTATGAAALRLRDETGAVLFLYASEDLVFGRDAAGGDTPRVCLRALSGEGATERSLRISGRHFALRRSGTRWTVRDLGSANGTKLDGERLLAHAEHELKDGARLSIADVLELRARLIGSTVGDGDGAAAPSLLLERIGDGESHRYLCVAAPVALDLASRPVGVGAGSRILLADGGLLWTRSGSTLLSAENLGSGTLNARPIEADDHKR